jgi:hypothetical protein
MFRISVGNFDVSIMTDANRILGPVFFFLYAFIVLFILLNVFVAVVNEAYQATRTVSAANRDRIYLLGYLTKVRNIRRSDRGQAHSVHGRERR